MFQRVSQNAAQQPQSRWGGPAASVVSPVHLPNDAPVRNGRAVLLAPPVPMDVKDTSRAVGRRWLSRRHCPGAGFAYDGSPRLPFVDYDDDGYPSDDGSPRVASTQQWAEVVYAYDALLVHLSQRYPSGFVASDLGVFAIPDERRETNRRAVAPDIMVSLESGCHMRPSYKLIDGEPIPDFVLEVLSASTADNDLGPKRRFCEILGVQEYWTFDPRLKPVLPRLVGHALRGDAYERMPPAPGVDGIRSEVLDVTFRYTEREDNSPEAVRAAASLGANHLLRILDPTTGRDFESHLQVTRRADAEQARADAEQARADAAEAELARLRAKLDDA